MREEGPAALYKGFAPKVLRLAPGGGVLLLVVEFTLGLFRQGAFVFPVRAPYMLTRADSARSAVHLECPLPMCMGGVERRVQLERGRLPDTENVCGRAVNRVVLYSVHQPMPARIHT